MHTPRVFRTRVAPALGAPAGYPPNGVLPSTHGLVVVDLQDLEFNTPTFSDTFNPLLSTQPDIVYLQSSMGRRGRAAKRSVGPPLDRASSVATTIIRGTSTRPLISYAADQPPVILADVAVPVSEPVPIKEVTKSESDDQVDAGDQSPMEDDRLYCICRRLYDGRTMIACDR